VNLNKVFPRLSIRAKLAIAFAVLAVVPLTLVAVLTVRQTIDYLKTLANATLAHDVAIANSRVERALERTERDVTYLAQEILAPVLQELTAGPSETPLIEVHESVARFLAHAPTLFRVKLVSRDGRILFAGPVPYARHDDDFEAPAGLLYSLQAESLGPGERLLMPVELRSLDDAEAGFQPIPAIALVLALRGEDGRFAGAVVGEAYAEDLFAGIEDGSPNMPAATGLVNPDGQLLYHSDRKADWRSLLGSGPGTRLSDEFSDLHSRAILAGRRGSFETPDGRIVSYASLGLGTAGLRRLTLYRVLPVKVLNAPIRTFETWVLVTGLLVVVAVLFLAFRAARQLTKPIYRLQEGFARLAGGEMPEALGIETNDEFEDLASDFLIMGSALHSHRRRLEELVEERTQAFLKTHAELGDILAYSADAIVGLDGEGLIRVWNHGAEEMFGHTEAEVLNRTADSVLLPEELRGSPEEEYLRREIAESGSVVGLRTRRRAKDGELVPVSLTQTIIADPEGQPQGMSLIMRDARTQEKLEEQLKRSERLAAVSVMAAGLAHELNNPLAVLANRIECMEQEVRDGADVSSFTQDLQVLGEHTARLGGVTRDLLRFARDYDEEPVPIDLGEICRRIAGLLERSLAAKGVRLTVDSGSDLPLFKGSERAIETVCMNLLVNAADAMPSGGSVEVRARLSQSGDAAEMVVQDTGPGVPVHLRQRIFEPFFTRKGNGKGMGLGLALCRSIVERHGGRIWVESGEDRGSRFVVSLPLHVPELT
jgi:PAS domain S-box-containing protein